ncbi:MAG: hypothetical protein Q9212_006154, partial [Teloschistes hypoglaucus]
MTDSQPVTQISQGEIPFSIPSAGKECKIWFQVHGQLSPDVRPLVILHGGPGIPHNYMLPLIDLTRSYHIPIIFYDQVGCGRSTHLPEKKHDESFWTTELFLDELDNVLKYFEIENNYDLLGQSWGGMLGACHAIRQPKGLKNLIIANSPPDMPSWMKVGNEYRSQLPKDVQETLDRCEKEGKEESEEYEQAMIPFYERHVCRTVPWPEDLTEAFKQLKEDNTVYLTMNGPSEFHITGTLKTFDVRPDLHKINVPTFLINGRYDNASDEVCGPFWKSIPKVKWYRFAESSHLPQFEEREEFMRLVAEFLGYRLHHLYLSEPVVNDANYGILYRGLSIKGVEHFHNIFYAQDTSGSKRFRPPVPLNPSHGSVIDATAPGAWCPQGVGAPPLLFASPITNVSENCLSLRIARYCKTRADAKLPVVVWIHGGGNAIGNAEDEMYHPDGLVKQAKRNGQPVVFVGINYRLGTFGGDPENVTAIGQSVGAASIGIHLTSYGGKKGVPFHKAIMLSGASGYYHNLASPIVTERTALVAKSLDCIRGDADSDATLECLRTTPFERLLNVSVSIAREAKPPFGDLFFDPTCDGDYIPELPSISLRKGNFVKHISIIASWVRNDGAWYAPPDLQSSSAAIATIKRHFFGLSPASISRLEDLYPVSDFTHLSPPNSIPTPYYHLAAQVHRDFLFTCPVLDFTSHYHRHAQNPKNTRIYEFNSTRHGPGHRMMGVPFWGVAHLSDIPYILNTEEVPN